MREAIAAAGERGCDIRILTMDVDNPSFASFLNPEVSSIDVEGQRAAIAQTREWFSDALSEAKGADVRSLSTGSLNQQIIVSDTRCLVSPYLYSANTGHSPCIEVTTESTIYDVFLHEFNTLWSANSPAIGSGL